MTDREVFKQNLYNLMKEAKIKQADLAKYAMVSQKTVSAWICGRGYPRAEAMERICKFFNVRTSALTDDHSSAILEDELLTAFRSLPQEGKQKLLERASELKRLYPMRRRNNG